MQRTTAVVHLDRLQHNLDEVRKRLHKNVSVMAVLKGDAYGHGIAGIYPTLNNCGIQHYAVAICDEGIALRQAGAENESILILGDTWDEDLEKVVRFRLTPTIFSLETAEKLNAAAEAQDVIQPVHIKIDTGMNRIGFKANTENVRIIEQISKLPNIRIAGMYTHFSRADELDNRITDRQINSFKKTHQLLKNHRIEIPLIHMSNSPAILLRPNAHCKMVRAGDVLFGLCPIEENAWEQLPFKDVLTWETYVVMIKTVPAGEAVGYGGTYVTTKPTVIATIPVGFADGYSRRLSNKGYVIINGQKAPVLGRICMDQFMVDVSDIPNVQRGTIVHLLDGHQMSILKMANLIDANVDEIVCGISKRVPRVYRTE